MTTTACLWCGHEEEYRPNNKASKRRCKARMSMHEIHCDESPVVKENTRLRKVCGELTSLTQRRDSVLEKHLNPRRKVATPSSILDELAQLARGTVTDDDVIVAINRKDPETCAACGGTSSWNIPYRISTPSATMVQLLCPKCTPANCEPHSTVTHNINERSEAGHHEMAFLWEDGGRVRMLWGENLHVETIR